MIRSDTSLKYIEYFVILVKILIKQSDGTTVFNCFPKIIQFWHMCADQTMMSENTHIGGPV